MSELIVKKIKKYLLYISSFFFLLILIHLVYLYLYDEAESEAINGGSVSEAIIGNFPHFNPLIPSNDHNAYINRLLYRSMMEYSTTSGSLDSDLTSCNLENLLYIECILGNNLTWSDGSSITTRDIQATLNIIKETKVNPIIASLLEDTTIEISDDSISFTRSKKDINVLYLFLQPILPERVVETLNSENVDGKFSEIGALYSGRFRLVNINQDETVGVTKLTLGKNESYFGNKLYLDFLILNLYRDENHFLKNKNSFNIFNDNKNLLGESIPRLEVFNYVIPQFTASFFNTETLSLNLRSYISNALKRESLINAVGKDKVLPVLNPFLSEINIDSEIQGSYNLEEALGSSGYSSKKQLLKNTLTQNIEEKTISQEAIVVKKQETNLPVQGDISYIISPKIQKYNFVSESNILLEGKVDAGVDSVYINDYKLSGFTPGDTTFFYRLLESYDSIALGENSYKIYFGKGKEKVFIEEFFYIYETDTEKLSQIESTFFQKEVVLEEQNTTESGSPSAGADETGDTTNESTPVTNLTNTEIENLNDAFYYNADGTPFSITLLYSQNDIDQELAANNLVEQIEALGIKVNPIAMSLGDITTGLRNETLEYDIMLLGINLGFLESDIFPYFHSSQVQNGYNISNFKKLSLDILLEELKSNRLSQSKQDELIAKILEILKNDSIIYTLYTPKISLMVDKNLKNFSLPEYLPDNTFRYYPLIESYLSEKKIIQSEDKNISNFISFIFKKLIRQ